MSVIKQNTLLLSLICLVLPLSKWCAEMAISVYFCKQWLEHWYTLTRHPCVLTCLFLLQNQHKTEQICGVMLASVMQELPTLELEISQLFCTDNQVVISWCYHLWSLPVQFLNWCHSKPRVFQTPNARDGLLPSIFLWLWEHFSHLFNRARPPCLCSIAAAFWIHNLMRETIVCCFAVKGYAA